MLSSFGAAKAYPVYAKLANLPTEVRNGKGLGAGRLVGWLPVVRQQVLVSCERNADYIIQVKDDARFVGDREWVNYKRVIWHECFRTLLESIRVHSESGCAVRCGDDVVRRFFPFVLILSADYEEQCVIGNLWVALSTADAPLQSRHGQHERPKYISPMPCLSRSQSGTLGVSRCLGLP